MYQQKKIVQMYPLFSFIDQYVNECLRYILNKTEGTFKEL